MKIDFTKIDNGWMDLDEWVCLKDTFIIRTLPITTTKKTEGGIIISSTERSVINDRPDAGIVVSTGPDTKFKIGEYVFIEKGKGYDLSQIRKDSNDYFYMLLYDDAVIGKKSPKEGK